MWFLSNLVLMVVQQVCAYNVKFGMHPMASKQAQVLDWWHKQLLHQLYLIVCRSITYVVNLAGKL